MSSEKFIDLSDVLKFQILFYFCMKFYEFDWLLLISETGRWKTNVHRFTRGLCEKHFQKTLKSQWHHSHWADKPDQSQGLFSTVAMETTLLLSLHWSTASGLLAWRTRCGWRSYQLAIHLQTLLQVILLFGIHFWNMTIYANNIEKIIEIFQCMVLKGVHVYTFFYSIIRW